MRKMSPRDMRRIMQKMGMEINEVEDVEEVIIVRRGEILKMPSPKVSIIKMGDQTIVQIAGGQIIVESKEQKTEQQEDISEEDVQLVAMQAKVSLDEARKALKQTGGDLAKAILTLTTSKGEKTNNQL
ncbi:MAG: nascent polypeptide-associated complex protein [archaeon YNP-LCB-003-016]|uniref:nascent polypeptide-associated complex protein n=1 Tax=Candidatus Culexarchaeum yellowstonense TaxID=2928963 RepID=UPI0026ECC723|nr:nascent polypeptide-associated complex protein [Candidatus Culexarchaeum yellowstonense]MCR6669096.1 nascent polypeptide-associated complex protein [Candidatus Culexarchaeum yellowstonense]MCR6690964.1 nascent polypeptide-associated complex protein [Candidatus Culexarchaeum yellowstonense]